MRSQGRYSVMTLTTFRDLPFNGPFYAWHGFTELIDLPWLGAAAASRSASWPRRRPSEVGHHSALELQAIAERLARQQSSAWSTASPELESSHTHPLDAGPCMFLTADALVPAGPRGRVVHVHALLAVAADGHWGSSAFEVTSPEDGAGWLGSSADLNVPA